MRYIVKKILILLTLPGRIICDIGNRLTMYSQDVKYLKYPEISGRIFVFNTGQCSIGQGIKFRSTTKSNFVGIYKPCSLFVARNATLRIGNNSGFSGISIFCSSSISIGDYVNCGGNVSIWDTDFHPLDYEKRRIHDLAEIRSGPVKIGNDVFIGANSIILKGVTIGNKSIVGAGSVVTKNIPEGEIWSGNPAKYIRSI